MGACLYCPRNDFSSVAVSPEFELLLVTASTACDESRADRIGSLLSGAQEGAVDWQALLALAEYHGTRPLLYRQLVRGRFNAAVPQETMETLAGANRRNAGRNLAMAAELIRLVERLRDDGIRVLAFKGPTLAVLAYGDLSLRQFNDIDLLAPAGDFDRASRLITSAGYRLRYPLSPKQEQYYSRRSGQLLYRNDNGLLVELHSRLISGNNPARFGFDELWSRRQAVGLGETGGTKVDTFGNDDLMLYMAMHGSKHRWPFLGWLCDWGELMGRHPELDWPNLTNRARDARCEKMLGVAVSLLVDVLGTQAPAAVEVPFADNEVVGSLANKLSQSLSSGRGLRGFEGTWVDFRMQDRKCDGARMVLAQVFDQHISDWEAVNLPDGFMGMYFLLRPFRLLLARIWKRQ